MNYEKEYKAALGRARNLHKDAIDMGDSLRAKMAEIIFPELQESEDEEIRTWLEEHIEAMPDNSVEFKDVKRIDILHWLEKQVPVDAKGIVEGVKQGIALSIIDFLDKNTTGMDMSSGECKGLEDAILDSDWMKVYRYMKKKLEKQDKKKSTNEVNDYNSIDPHFYKPQGKSALEAIKEEKVDNANKVETMFNVGDWIVTTGRVSYKVIDIREYRYEVCYMLIDTDNKEYESGIQSIERDCRLWTIQDAEDGDVLVASDGSIFVFAGTDDCYCKHYVALATNGVIVVNKGLKQNWEDSCGVHPATKEERELLFSKMGERGYEWDADNKQLIKLL